MGTEALHNSIENKEKGSNVRIDLKIIRHGERTKTGELTDYGRSVTKIVARPNEVEGDWLDATEVIGSNVDPNDSGLGRALETADIYAQETDGSAIAPKPEDRLNYKHIKSPMPYDHIAIYNSFLPKDFDQLPDEEKVKAAKVAQDGVMNHLLTLKTPEADDYRKETAGAFANIVLEYQEQAHKLKSWTSKRVIAGTHGGSMEFLLQQTLTHEENGERRVGFNDFKVIGGIFYPSESYDVVIETDQDGKNKALRVLFDDPNRCVRTFELDLDKVKELSKFYESKQQKL